jgi:hypothetical protein
MSGRYQARHKTPWPLHDFSIFRFHVSPSIAVAMSNVFSTTSIPGYIIGAATAYESRKRHPPLAFLRCVHATVHYSVAALEGRCAYNGTAVE